MNDQKDFIPPEAVEYFLGILDGKELAYVMVPSRSHPDKEYKVRVFLTCECEGYKYHRHCDHIRQAVRDQLAEWEVVDTWYNGR